MRMAGIDANIDISGREDRSFMIFIEIGEKKIIVKSGERAVEISRKELGSLMGERYPSTDHHRLNLPGLLFLQSSPALQTASAILLRREHKLQITWV